MPDVGRAELYELARNCMSAHGHSMCCISQYDANFFASAAVLHTERSKSHVKCEMLTKAENVSKDSK